MFSSRTRIIELLQPRMRGDASMWLTDRSLHRRRQANVGRARTREKKALVMWGGQDDYRDGDQKT
jgi:hypothetical protein